MSLTCRQKTYLNAMGITLWESQTSPVDDATEARGQLAENDTNNLNSGSSRWDDLVDEVSTCMRCALHQSRTRVVFGVGNRQADILIIGEAPGAEEDRQGEPFVGRAGQLLNEMLKSIGLQRQDIYIANILKCRPPNNRDPKPEEAAECTKYLYRQIELIRPKVILAVGRIAAQRLLQTDTSLSRLRGRVHTHPQIGVPLIVTYHPAYLLRSPMEKRKAWEDLIFTKKTIESNS